MTTFARNLMSPDWRFLDASQYACPAAADVMARLDAAAMVVRSEDAAMAAMMLRGVKPSHTWW